MMNRKLKILSLLAGLLVLSATQGSTGAARTLKFYHTHTGESLQVTYFSGGDYVPSAIEEIRVFLADWRNHEQQDIDPRLMDALWKIQQLTGNDGTYEVISAYRSEETNQMLRARSNGVAKKSQHLLGKAVDVRLQGLDLEQLRETALELELGGVGFYPKSDFVHVDTGRVRFW